SPTANRNGITDLARAHQGTYSDSGPPSRLREQSSTTGQSWLINTLLRSLNMNAVMEADTSVASLRADLRDFYDDYGTCLDALDLEGWINFFTDDCHYRVISQENMQANLPLGLIYCMNKNMLIDRVTAIRETTMYEPRMLRHFI